MKIFIGFDAKNKNIRILKADKSSGVESFSFRFQSYLFSDRFYSEFQTLLSEFVNSNNLSRNTSAYIVMPDNTVGLETFDLPYMNKAKMLKALETELNNEYGPELKDKKVSKFLITSTRQFSTFGVVFFDKKTILQINKVLSDAKLLPRGATYDGNAVVNSVLHFMPRSHGKNFVVADIRSDKTEIAICSKGKTLGVTSVPFGVSVINNPEVCDEYAITDHTAADIAVINAREVAKAKTLTTNEEEEQPLPETVAEEATAQPAEAEEANTEAANAETTAEVASDATEDASDDEDFEDEETEETAETASEEAAAEEITVADPFVAAANVPKSKVYRKAKRRLPKFMKREVPEEAEKIAYENFRIILKWILLYARQARMTAYINDPDYIIVNLPENLHYLIDMANEEQGEDGIKLRPLKGMEKQPAEVSKNIDLYGVNFIGSYNHNHNFFNIRFGLK
ncbi:MAG: hypothetical protein LUD27_01105 [Clostridia bacterium]|nr:hypothetical protein [Clostridia bacterium]